MRRSVLRIMMVAALVSGATVAVARLNGPPRGATGTWALGGKNAEKNCQFCHDPEHALNDSSGSLEILDVPTIFDVDTDYPVRVRLTHTWETPPPDPLTWGFQLTAVRSDSGTGYGTFTPGPGTQVATSGQGQISDFDASRSYLEQNGAGTHVGDSGPVEWSFTWRSPSYAAAKVYFFAAGNAGDGATTSSGDFIFTAVDSMEYVNVAVPLAAHGGTELAPPWPNPAHHRAELRYAIGRAAWVDLSIFDVRGRRLRTLVRGHRDPGTAVAVWDGCDATGARLESGVYFAKLSVRGDVTVSQRITLTR